MSRSGKAVAEVASAPDVDIESRLHFFKKRFIFGYSGSCLLHTGFL